jgi:hypothetical protein
VFLGGLGLGMATRSLVLTAVTAAVLATLLARAAVAEERALAQRYGAAYAGYATTTPRWLPRRLTAAPAQLIEVHLPLYWKAFRDAGAVVLLYLLIDAARTLRVLGVLPTLLPLP